jgi:outer membrane protein OmpA-like peptidoglycan-associated protein
MGFALFTLAVVAALSPAPLEAQILKQIKKTVTKAAEQESLNQIDRLVRGKIRCVFDDLECVRDGEQSGKGVVLTDDEGEIMVDQDGKPVSDPKKGAEIAQEKQVKPGEGVWANYDFVPGDDILYFDDYSGDRVGSFPRRMNFVRGNWEVVEWQGRRLLRNSGPRYAAIEIPLPSALPDRFTIEFDVYMPHGNHRLAVATYSPAADGGNWTKLRGNFFQAGGRGPGSGVVTGERGGPEALTRGQEFEEALSPLRITVDERYAMVYVGSKRVANVPNAELQRSETVYIENMYMNGSDNPIYIGPIRIAGGGRDLYDRLAKEGRVATQGIFFATNSDRIRPESTPTLEEIGTMLKDHPELRIAIEGHTDSDGEDAYNQTLSEKRAAAVKAYLTATYGIQDSRLQTAGFGESKPVEDNATPEGKQQNRRVELVRVEQ